MSGMTNSICGCYSSELQDVIEIITKLKYRREGDLNRVVRLSDVIDYVWGVFSDSGKLLVRREIELILKKIYNERIVAVDGVNYLLY